MMYSLILTTVYTNIRNLRASLIMYTHILYVLHILNPFVKLNRIFRTVMITRLETQYYNCMIKLAILLS